MDLYNLVISAKLQKGGGGGGDVTVEELNVTSNGSYSASSGYAYSPVNVSVPGIVPSGTSAITANGIYDVTNFASASVSVPIPSGYIQPTGTSSITSNGIYDITSFASVDVNVSGGGGGGDHDAEDGIVTRTISGAYENSRVTLIGSFAFANCTSLTAVSFPNALTINGSAFTNCTSLTAVSFPNVASIGINAFYSCSKLTTISFPNAKTIGNYAFNSCSSLTTASFPNGSTIGSSAFNFCISLTTASFPNVSIIYSNAFYSCSKLTTISFPNAKTIGNYAFANCTSLTAAYFLASSVTSLASYVFINTPISSSSYTGSFGSIYVPASLVDSYKAAKNWSVYKDRITSYVE